MKKLIVAIIALVTFGNVALAQSMNGKQSPSKSETAKVIAMVNTASWCPACKANGQRVEKDIISQYMNNDKVVILVNDLSNKESKASSKEKCMQAGVSSIASKNKATGVIYFINSETKEVISKISVTETNEDIKQAFEKAISKI